MNDTTESYKCLNVSNYKKVVRSNSKSISISPSTSLLSSTGDSSTCHDDSTTLDGNDSTYYDQSNIENYESYFDASRSITNELEIGNPPEKICKNCDRLIRQVTTLKEQLYSDWNNRIKPLHDGIAVKQDIIDCYKKQIECFKIELDKSRNEVLELKEALRSSQQVIERNLNALKIKQQECENTKILLEDALNSINMNSKNMNSDKSQSIASQSIKSLNRYATRSSNKNELVDYDIFN